MSSVKNFPTYKTAQYFPIILYYRRRRRRRDRMPERKGQLNRTHTHTQKDSILYIYEKCGHKTLSSANDVRKHQTESASRRAAKLFTFAPIFIRAAC